ncbi:Actin-binding FH2 [Cynara cardunculus var. scolymus]|uniref:Methyltransferase n=1 Tax=Cynara cardunculus var. scolymus TaxID=59895 RepID=A0A103YIS6_CYNCS|nr:Actin-binding FH2 [Cynara cardunculus var. scolymus]
MKGSGLLKSSIVVKTAGIAFIALSFFYLGKHWSDDTYQQLIFFSSNSSPNAKPPSISVSPNFNKTFDIKSLINDTTEVETVADHTLAAIPPASLLSPPPPPPPPPPPTVQRLGVVDENGVMRDEFEVGEYDPDVGENRNNETKVVEGDKGVTFRVPKFDTCPVSMREYIPCLDNEEAIKGLKSTEKGEKFERHCPEKDKGLNCLVPAPKGYKAPIPWPRSRDEVTFSLVSDVHMVWYSNVPHAQLAEYKGGQNWITVDKDKFKFPGGGTQFIHGADQYLDQISQMIPDIAFGRHTRVALDVGCGVASFSAYLFSRNVLTMSVAPKDVHENQIQFALERGVPAMVAAFATRRLLYPSQAFELIHCSRCRVNWTRDDGILLLEVNRLLRAGGYFAWAAQPVYKHEPLLEEQWEEMINLTTRLCWNLVKKEGYIAIWQKPLNNSCYLSRELGTQPPLCDEEDDPDDVWYVGLKPCISRLPEDLSGANITTWPERLDNPPERLQSIKLDAYVSRKDLFRAESKYWKEIIDSYVRALRWKTYNLRNVLDMRAGFGSFAAALINNQVDCWVMNVVPVSGPNTLPVIYDRGLLGVMHDWCEPFDTYPRTYDLLHAAGLFSIEQKRCNISSIMVEMDRILRPGGRVYIRDSISVMNELEEIGKAIGWRVMLRDTAEGPHASYRVLTCDKNLR